MGFKAVVDCNSFYCSCERVFRPDLWNKPVVVLSNNDGCIISRSDEAKKLGVGMAGPYFKARHIIEKNGVSVFSSNYHLYGDMSRRVMECLRVLLEDGSRRKVEVYSIDEAFLDLGDIPTGQLLEYGHYIKNTVEQWTGISVSVGIASTKTLAKMANHMAKKNKKATACVKAILTEDDQRIVLQQSRVTEIWGVGRAYSNKLLNWGITSAWELSNMSEEWAHSNMGGVVGVRLIRELRGFPSILMEEELLYKKMIATTRMFGRAVTELSELKEAVATYISRAAEKLRRQNSAAKIVSVFLVPREQDYSVDFKQEPSINSHSVLPAATSFTHELIKPAIDLVENLFEKGREYKKAGVMLGGLVPDKSVQGNLFISETGNGNRFLMSAIDNVNFGMREDAVKFASSGLQKNWKMRQELRSGRCSTRWEDIREVK
ncbi:MAG TPA: Y-family DNA polymerase [Puia sp.]|nr:Y-family DNA polymerase [Puia sp.]